MSSGALDIEDKDIRLIVEYRNGNVLFLVSTIYYEGRNINYLTPVTFLKNIDSDVAKNIIERIKLMMISVGNNKMSLKDFLNEVPQFKMHINDDGKLSSSFKKKEAVELSDKKNEKVFSKGGYPINKAIEVIEVIELQGEELEDNIEIIRLWVESSYSKNEISFDEYFNFKRRLISCEVKKLEKKYHVKCCVSISELTDINSAILG